MALEDTKSFACPSFAEAVRLFQDFLEGQGWPTHILWVAAGDVERRPRHEPIIHLHPEEERDEATRREFELGRRRGLGVRLQAVCTLGQVTCATIESPQDERQAELEMYPSDGGLKLSVPVTKEDGSARWPVC